MKKLLALLLLALSLSAMADLTLNQNQAQSVTVHARDKDTGLAVTGDAANMSAICNRWTGTGTVTSAPCGGAFSETGTTGSYKLPLTATETSEQFYEVIVTGTADVVYSWPYGNSNAVSATDVRCLVRGNTTAAGGTSSVDTDLTGYTDGHFATGHMGISFESGPLARSSYVINSYVATGGTVGWRPPALAPPGSGNSFCIYQSIQ